MQTKTRHENASLHSIFKYFEANIDFSSSPSERSFSSSAVRLWCCFGVVARMGGWNVARSDNREAAGVLDGEMCCGAAQRSMKIGSVHEKEQKNSGNVTFYHHRARFDTQDGQHASRWAREEKESFHCVPKFFLMKTQLNFPSFILFGCHVDDGDVITFAFLFPRIISR